MRASFYARHLYSYRLQNIEDGTVIIFYTNQGSPWLKTLADAEKWLKEQEAERQDPDNTSRPNSKWVFLSHFSLDLKVVLDRQPLVGTGPLPDWLRNLARGGHAMVALDTYQDNLCLWRCIAVHKRGWARSKHKSSSRSRQEFLQAQDYADRLSKNITRRIRQGGNTSE